MNSTNIRDESLLFICSPSLGILDTWLPVLFEIKSLKPDIQIHCAIPKHITVTKIDPENVLIQMADEIFSSVICKTADGNWVYMNSFKQAKDFFISRTHIRFLRKVANKIPNHRLSAIIVKVTEKLRRRSQRLKNVDYLFRLSRLTKSTQAILFDVYTEKKENVNDILGLFEDLPKFSMSHGLKVKNINTYQDLNIPLNEDTIVYIHSENEKNFVRDRFGIPESKHRVVGVPRHEEEWIQNIVEREKLSGVEIGRDFIFLISRPHTTGYHPKSRMREALKHIRKLAWSDLNKKIVVKLHPKERHTGIYEQVFGKANYGARWIYSNLHPFVLGDRCDFAIAFYSGVVVDMIAMGVPSIELMDLRGLPKYDNENSLRDSNNEPVFEYRYNDLALGASDYPSLKREAARILADRESVMQMLHENYRKHYHTKEGVTTQIATEILAKSDIISQAKAETSDC